MSTTLMNEVFGVRQFLGSPLEQAPSTRQIIQELEAEYHQLTMEVSNRGQAQLVGEVMITTAQNDRRYQLPDEAAANFYKALSVTTVPANATVTGDHYDKVVSVDSGDDREQTLEFMELAHFSDDWAWLAPSRGQLFGSAHDSQAIAFYKVVHPEEGEQVFMELRPTPNAEQRYMILYQITDWWDRIFLGGLDGVQNNDFQMPHSSQRMMIRCYAALNLIQKAVVKWSLNDEYNAMRGTVVSDGLKDRLERYRKAYEDWLDTLEHGDVVYVELWQDRL